MYVKKYPKYEKHFQDLELHEENLYESRNAFLLLLGQKIDNGQILFCTASIQDICGGNKESYYKSHVSKIFPPSLQNYYSNRFKGILDTNNDGLMSRIERVYLYHRRKYIVEADLYIQVHPYINQSLYLNMIIRPVPLTREYILVRENGDIEGATETISEILKISAHLNSSGSSSTSIKLLSGELLKVNEAFNIVHKNQLAEKSEKSEIQSPSQTPQTKLRTGDTLSAPTIFSRDSKSYFGALDHGKALDIYNKFNSEGKKVDLRPVPQSSNKSILGVRYSFHCTVSLLQYGAITMKLFALEEILQEEEGEQHYDEAGDENKMDKGNVIGRQPTSPTDFFKSHDSDHNSDSGAGSENIKDCQEAYIGLAVNTKKETTMNTDDNFISPKSVLTSHTKPPILFARPETKHIESRFKVKNVLLNLMPSKKELIRPKKNSVKRREIEVPESSINQSHQTRKENSINKAFRTAITTKTYSKSFAAFSLLFYGVIIGTLISQIVLKITSDNTMTDLNIKNRCTKPCSVAFILLD